MIADKGAQVQRGSVEGLSWKLFMFAIMGNTAYGLSIFLRSLDATFLLDRLPWLVGRFVCA
jgi:hypothetical protein